MLTIRDAQLAAMSDGLLEQWIVLFLRKKYAGDGRLDEAGWLGELVSDGVRQARSRGIATPQTARSYVECRFLLRSDLEQEPDCAWAREILNDEELLMMERLEMLLQKISEREPAA